MKRKHDKSGVATVITYDTAGYIGTVVSCDAADAPRLAAYYRRLKENGMTCWARVWTFYDEAEAVAEIHKNAERWRANRGY